jgi:hypothetical protein
MCTAQLVGIKKVGREAPARDDHSPGRAGDRSSAWRKDKESSVEQVNEIASSSENTKLPCAHAPVKLSPLGSDPLTRRLAPTIDSRSAAGPGPHRPKRRTLPFWLASIRSQEPTFASAPNLLTAKLSRIQADLPVRKHFYVRRRLIEVSDRNPSVRSKLRGLYASKPVKTLAIVAGSL